MSANTTGDQKRAVEQLQFGTKTAKRATWEAFEFTVVDSRKVEVVNASYGDEKDAHRYVVTVDEQDGVPVPAECGCKADEYSEEYDCKHKVALATVGGPVVLEAAATFSPNSTPSREIETETTAETLKSDGGTLETCPNGDSQCDGPESVDLPCFDCFERKEA